MSSLYDSTKGVATEFATKGRNLLDGAFPPEQRASLQSRIQAFANTNPKLAAFLLANAVLSGVPLLTFLTFSVSVFVFSVLTALIVGTLLTVFVTAWAVGFALLFFLPAVFLTTLLATFVWVWGMGAYFVFQWLNREDRKEAIDSKLRQITGGMVNGVEATKSKAIAAKDDVKGEFEPVTDGHKQPQKHAAVNGTSHDVLGEPAPTNPYAVLDPNEGTAQVPSVEA